MSIENPKNVVTDAEAAPEVQPKPNITDIVEAEVGSLAARHSDVVLDIGESSAGPDYVLQVRLSDNLPDFHADI